MLHRSTLWGLAFSVLGGLGSAGLAAMAPDDPAKPAATSDAELDAGLKLLKDGDASADAGKSTEAEVLYQQAMEKLLPGIRHLPFKHPVQRDVTPRDKIRDYLLKELEEDETPEEFRADELAMKAFGLLPPELDYKETLMKLLTEQIGAFYDPQTDTMHLILESEETRNKKPGFFEKLLGMGGGFDKENSKTIIAHELTHALSDQYYDLDKLSKAIKHNDDRELALAGLIEGEATLAMMAAQSKDWKGTETAAMPADLLGGTMGLLSPFMSMVGGAQISSVPPIMSEPLLFPYLNGMVFCAHLTNARGWPAIDEAYRNLPQSTEQILHPEKYRNEPDPPTLIDLGPLAAPAGWSELTRNVLGELQTSILLKKQKGKSAAAGWDGDQFALFEGPSGRLGLVWRSIWDSEADAAEFFDSLARYHQFRFGGEATPGGSTIATRVKDGSTYRIERRGCEVVSVEGFPESDTIGLNDAAWKGTATESGPN